MGGSDSKYLSSSDLSDSASEEYYEAVEYANIDQQTDAALRATVSLPKAEDVLNLDKVMEIEEQLDHQEIVSLIYLLSEDKQLYYFLQQLFLMTKGGDKKIISKWAKEVSKKDKNWHNKLIEGLCVIKNYYILKLLGYDKFNAVNHFLPNNTNSLHLNKNKKCIYLICDGLGSQEMTIFLNLVKKHFNQRNIKFNEMNTEYLEMYFLQWEIEDHLDLHEIKRILKLMNEDRLYNILDSALPGIPHQLSQQKVTESLLAINERPSTSFEIPQNSLSLIEAVNFKDVASRVRKPSSGTSIDNNILRSEMPYENNYLEYQHSLMLQDNIDRETDNINIYSVDQEKPGIVLIINQQNFYSEIDRDYQHLFPPDTQGKLEYRGGSEKDRDRLKDVFKEFGFEVFVKDSINHLELIQSIKEITDQVKEESSLFICIMSHGDQGIVYGSNSCSVKVSEIQEIMSSNNKENLSGKPKVLILQSCQGQECQTLETDNSTSEEQCCLTTDSGHPIFRDMYTFWATIRGYAAIRNRKTGSWFIQALCKEMLQYGNKHHFADICTRVKRQVTEQIWKKTEKDKIVMTPIVESTLVKDFFLPRRKSNE